MFSKTLSTVAVALAASSLVSAQTSTDCNPLTTTCPADGAVGSNSISCDFTKGACDAFELLPATSITYDSNLGAVFTMNTQNDAPTIRTTKYIFFGRVDVVIQAAPGAGFVTSAVLQSDDLDEIDIEFVGSDNTQWQTNYFSKGNTDSYNRGAFEAVSNPTGSFHTYSVIWTSSGVQWLLDGVVQRTLTAENAEGGAAGLPQTPMQIKLGTWVGGSTAASVGTQEWAGGLATAFPAVGYYKSISIVDYAGGDGPTTQGVSEYVYSDHSGTWESIQVVGGSSENTTTTATSSSSSSTPSSSSSSSSPSSSSPSSSSPSSSSSSSSSSGSSAAVSAKSGSSTATDSSVPTTLATATAVATGSASNSTAAGTGALKTTATPTAIPQSAGSRSIVALGSAIAAGAGVLLAQLLL